jgi:hypothetical protein
MGTGHFDSSKTSQNDLSPSTPFDKRHLPELGGYAWYDIMKLAAYRQYNPKIPASMEFRKR